MLVDFGADLDAAGARTIQVGRDIAFPGRFGWSEHFLADHPPSRRHGDLIEATAHVPVRIAPKGAALEVFLLLLGRV